MTSLSKLLNSNNFSESGFSVDRTKTSIENQIEQDVASHKNGNFKQILAEETEAQELTLASEGSSNEAAVKTIAENEGETNIIEETITTEKQKTVEASSDSNNIAESIARSAAPEAIDNAVKNKQVTDPNLQAKTNNAADVTITKPNNSAEVTVAENAQVETQVIANNKQISANHVKTQTTSIDTKISDVEKIHKNTDMQIKFEQVENNKTAINMPHPNTGIVKQLVNDTVDSNSKPLYQELEAFVKTKEPTEIKFQSLNIPHINNV